MSNLSILIVEDEAIVAEDLASKVRQLGYDIAGVTETGEEAIELARRHKPALVLMDIQLAGVMDGIAAAQQINLECNLPVLFLTAHSDTGTVERAQQAGVFGYILKPFSESDLRIQIEMALYKHVVERRLRESEERFRALTTAGSDIVYRMSPDWSEMLQLQGRGFVADTEKPNRNWLEEYIHPDDQSQVKMVINEAIRTKSIYELEHRVLSVDCTLGWMSTRAVPLLDTNGEIVEWFGAASDITIRKQVEAYREMGREVLHLLNGPEDFAYSIKQVLDILKKRTGFDAVGIRLQDNDDFPYFVQDGFSSDFLRKENSLKVRAADGGVCRDQDGNVRLECTCGLVISGKIDSDNSFFTAGGSFWINDSAPLLDIPSNEDPRLHPRNQCIHDHYASVALVPIRDKEQVVGLIQFNDHRKGCFTLDSIEFLEGIASYIGSALMRKQAEAALRESEVKYRALFQNMIDGFALHQLVVDETGKPIDYIFREVNSAFEKFTGLKAGDILNKKVTQVLPGIKTDSFDWINVYGKVALTGEEFRSEKYSEQLGRWYAVVAYRPMPSFFATVFEDITERKLAEKQLQAMNDDLERRVERRTSELQESQNQYMHAEKLSAIGKLSASIAHEFNNPLQGILSVLKGLEKRAILDEEDKELLLAAIGEGDRIKDLIRSLKDFNRPTSGRNDFIDVHDSLESILILQKSDLNGRRISVVRNYAKELPQIVAVSDQIKQVFLNLLTNAADACHKGGGIITISTRQENDSVAVAIKDTGVGIKPEEMEHIFRPFYTTKSEVKGTGLGLSVSFGIVQKHHGEIRVESQPGAGTTFTVLLPIKGCEERRDSANDE